MRKPLVLALGVAITGATPVNAAEWTFLPEASSLSFTATAFGQTGTVSFTEFDADIDFSRDNLSEGAVRVTVDLTSVKLPSFEGAADLRETLLGEPGFATDAQPQAVFQASEFEKLGEDSYKAEGTLTLRGETQPVSLSFTFEEFGPKPGDPDTLRAVAAGETTLNRKNYGVGRGQWEPSSRVKDDVKVTFSIAAERPASN